MVDVLENWQRIKYCVANVWIMRTDFVTTFCTQEEWRIAMELTLNLSIRRSALTTVMSPQPHMYFVGYHSWPGSLSMNNDCFLWPYKNYMFLLENIIIDVFSIWVCNVHTLRRNLLLMRLMKTRDQYCCVGRIFYYTSAVKKGARTELLLLLTDIILLDSYYALNQQSAICLLAMAMIPGR